MIVSGDEVTFFSKIYPSDIAGWRWYLFNHSSRSLKSLKSPKASHQKGQNLED